MGSSREATELEALLGEQLGYYRARAQEYDDWFLRRRGYDRGESANRAWFAQVEETRAALARELDALTPSAHVLELACGTGLWTERLARCARVHALDAAPEVLALNRERIAAASLADRVSYEQVDLFDWRPKQPADFVFFGFWLSHVPAERFDAFWALVDEALADGGRFFFVDNLRTRHHPFSDQNGERARRKLVDGREFEIVKVFHEPEVLQRRLSGMGYEVHVRGTEDFFLYGAGGRAGDE